MNSAQPIKRPKRMSENNCDLASNYTQRCTTAKKSATGKYGIRIFMMTNTSVEQFNIK